MVYIYMCVCNMDLYYIMMVFIKLKTLQNKLEQSDHFLLKYSLMNYLSYIQLMYLFVFNKVLCITLEIG